MGYLSPPWPSRALLGPPGPARDLPKPSRVFRGSKANAGKPLIAANSH